MSVAGVTFALMYGYLLGRFGKTGSWDEMDRVVKVYGLALLNILNA